VNLQLDHFSDASKNTLKNKTPEEARKRLSHKKKKTILPLDAKKKRFFLVLNTAPTTCRDG